MIEKLKNSHKMEKKSSMKQLQSEFNRLKMLENSFIQDIEKLKKKQPGIQVKNLNRNIKPITITNSSQKETESLEHLEKCLQFTQFVEGFQFSNEDIQYFPIRDEDDNNILYKKLYKTDCKMGDHLKFHIEFLVHEMLIKSELIKSIDVQINDPMQSIELQRGLNVLKKRKKLRLLYNALKQYSELYAQRVKVFNELPKENFEVTQEEGGNYLITAKHPEVDDDIFRIQWFIDWVPSIYNFMHSFEITVSIDDDWLDEQLKPEFELLCRYYHDINDTSIALEAWKRLIEIVTFYKP